MYLTTKFIKLGTGSPHMDAIAFVFKPMVDLIYMWWYNLNY